MGSRNLMFNPSLILARNQSSLLARMLGGVSKTGTPGLALPYVSRAEMKAYSKLMAGRMKHYDSFSRKETLPETEDEAEYNRLASLLERRGSSGSSLPEPKTEAVSAAFASVSASAGGVPEVPVASETPKGEGGDLPAPAAEPASAVPASDAGVPEAPVAPEAPKDESGDLPAPAAGPEPVAPASDVGVPEVPVAPERGSGADGTAPSGKAAAEPIGKADGTAAASSIAPAEGEGSGIAAALPPEEDESGADSEDGADRASGAVSINAAKLARLLAAAKTRSQVEAVIAQIEADLKECDQGKAQGFDLDEASYAAAERLLQQARQQLGSAENRQPTPEEEMASALAGLM